MLRRKPSRLELRPEDKEEYLELRQAAALATSSSSGNAGHVSVNPPTAMEELLKDKNKLTTAQRIGASK